MHEPITLGLESVPARRPCQPKRFWQIPYWHNRVVGSWVRVEREEYGGRGEEDVGAAPGVRFRTVQRRLGRWRVHFIIYCPRGKVRWAG